MKKAILVASIILLAAFMRLSHLGTFPPSLSIDEVSFTYNAYSVLLTGQDEHGIYMPLSFKSLGDYKLPNDIYLRIPVFKMLGVNEFSIRLPVAVASCLTIFLIILVLQKLGFSNKTSFFTGFWLSLLGWNIFYSRASFEAITALFYTILGLYWFLVWRKNNSSLALLGSTVVWGLSIWTYNTQRIFTPFLVTFLFLACKIKIKKITIPSLVFGSFFLALILLLVFDKSSLGRASDLFVTHDPVVLAQLHNNITDIFLIAKKVVEQYLNYYSLRFWFFKAGIITPQNYLGLGLLNVIDLPIFLLGIFKLIKSKNKFLKQLTVFWFLVGPIAAAFTRGDPSPIRIIVWMPFFIFVMAFGFEGLLEQKKRWLVGYLMGLVFCFSYFVDLYVHNFTKFYADQWHYGYKEAAIYACENHNKFKQIIVTDKYGIIENKIKTVPYLYFLIYCKISPVTYLQNREIYNITFRQPQWFYDSHLPNALLIGSQWDFPENFPKNWINKQINFPTGEPALIFVETSSQKSGVIK